MLRSMAILSLAAGCSGIATSRDAPFEMPKIKSALWSVSESEEPYGEAVLVLSSEGLSCADIEEKTLYEALANVTSSGTGLLFDLVQSPAEGEPLPAWTGLWTLDGAGIPSGTTEDWEGGRSMYIGAFDGGFYYELGYDSDNDWLIVEEIGERKVVAEFRSAWWWGSARAEPCGSLSAATTTTTTTTTTY